MNNIRNCNSSDTLRKKITKKIKQGSEIVEEEFWVLNKDARKITRDDAKLLYQVYLNGDYWRLAKHNFTPVEIRNYMKMKFPSVHEIIKDLKVRNVEVYDVLVEIETRLIFQIIEELYSKFDDIKILTCHDAIYVPKSFESRVREVWKSNMESFTLEFPYEKKEFEGKGVIEIVDFNEPIQIPLTDDDFFQDDDDDDFWSTPIKMY